jgi:RES domain-containing protein
VLVWRIAREAYALDRLGIGARNDGGRWNHPGVGVLYAGCTTVITAFEKFVHLAGITLPDLVLVRIELPEGHTAEKPAIDDLPNGWDAIPYGPASMDFGTTWAQENRSLVLFVPSTILREETNAVLNPNHPEFAGVMMSIERPFSFDRRIYEPKLPPKATRPKR